MKHLSAFMDAHRGGGRKHGQSLVEFALVLPVLLLFIMGTIDFGRALFTYAQATSQLRQALRLAAVIGLDSAPIRPYLDCDRMRATARNVFFAENIDFSTTAGGAQNGIMYLRAFSGPSSWNGSSFDEPPISSALFCPETASPDIGPSTVVNGDVLRIRERVSIRMITPLFPQLLSFTLQGQRTIITNVSLASVEYCGDLVCNGNPVETSSSCPSDCGTSGNSAPGVTILRPNLVYDSFDGVTIRIGTQPTAYTIQVNAQDADTLVDPPGSLTVRVDVTDSFGVTTSLTPPASITGNLYTFSWGGAANGTYTLQAFATDHNTPSPHTSSSATVQVVVDNSISPPTIWSIATNPPVVNTDATVQILINATDATDDPIPSVQVWADAGALVPPTGNAAWFSSGWYTITWTAPPSATTATIKVRATDSVGTWTEATLTVPVTVAGAPIITVNSPSGGIMSGSIPLTISVNDLDGLAPGTITSAQYKIDGGSWTDLPYSGSGIIYTTDWVTTSTDNGLHTIYYHVVDNTGKIGDASATVTVANATSMHVSGLTVDYTWPGGTSDWVGIVVITVVDNLGQPVAGVTVTGNWMAGIPSSTGRSNCLAPTNASGQCTITVGGIPKNKQLTFTMLAAYMFGDGTITGGTLTYVAGDNVVSSVVWGPPTVPK